MTKHLNVHCSMVISHLSGPSRIPYRRNVAASMSLQQSLVSYRKEWEPVEIILIVHFHSLGEPGTGVARRDQADQHTIHIHLIAVRCSSTTESSAVGEFGIGCRIERENITREAVLNGNRAAQVDDVVWIQGLGLLPADARPDPNETVGRVRLQHTIVRYAVRKDVTDWDLESDGEDIEAGEHVSRRCFGTRAPGIPPRSLAFKLTR